jgi:uncharacterized protein YndB with AHSA1/START domain
MNMQFSKDLENKKITVHREFYSPAELVWKAWTEGELLDQWWAPRPWVNKTKYLNFMDGGNWLYSMSGPDGTTHWSMVEFGGIVKYKCFQAASFFSDENGNRKNDFPGMIWKNTFLANGVVTRVEVEITVSAEADFKKIIEMGFETGFKMALGNLDELLAK